MGDLGHGRLGRLRCLGLSRFSYTSILPSMQQALGLTNTQARGLATANLAGQMAMAIVGGALASRFGPRRIVTGGLLLACIGKVTTGLAVGYSMVLGGASSLVSVPPARTSRRIP
jgi:MFS family permease